MKTRRPHSAGTGIARSRAASNGRSSGEAVTYRAVKRLFPGSAEAEPALRVTIKCPVPRESQAQYWGDYYFAQSLARALTRRGCRVRIEIVPQWYDGGSRNADLVIVLRGLTSYRVNRGQLNFCWVISHPEQVTDAELETYDHVFVASVSYAEQLRVKLRVPVDVLLQCSDPEIFHPPSVEDDASDVELLFVGNSRLKMRKIVKDCIDQNLPLTVHGRQWEGLIPPEMVRSVHIPNSELHRHYGKAKIVLNDHWPDMARHGFVSNRIFDVGLSGGFLVSDQFTDSEIFEGAVITYPDAPLLARLCERWLGDEPGRRAMGNRLRRLVLDAHTFDHRAAVIVDSARELRSVSADHPRRAEIKRLGAANRRAHSWLRQPIGAAQRRQHVQMAIENVREKLNESEALNLASALAHLQSCFDRLLESRRWQLGNDVGRAVDIVLLRPKQRPTADYIRDVLAAFAQWEADVVAGRRSPSAAVKDAPELAGWIERLDQAFEATGQSRRFRFGRAIGGLYDCASWGVREPFVTQEMQRIFLAVRYLRLDAATGQSTYATQFSRILACIGDDHFPVTLSQSICTTQFGRALASIVDDHSPAGLAERLVDSEVRLAEMAAKTSRVESPPLISIIMPTFDRAPVIGLAIHSVLEQDYPEWELFVCDDGSQDGTENVVRQFAHPRIHYLKLPRRGGSAARNAGMARARGSIFAYLDSDNIWHRSSLSAIASAFRDNPGRSAVYCDYIDYQVSKRGRHKILSFARPAFNHEQLLQKNFIDLNSFAHRRELYDCFGGFDERLTRRQDYDLILKYTWLRDPLHVPCLVTLYQRNQRLTQVTQALRHDNSCVPIIEASIAGYLRHGLPRAVQPKRRKVTVLSWDLCRNHFSKPFALAEALAKDHDVQLVAFRFFDEEIFSPLRDVTPSFETVYLPGSQFPDFFDTMSQAIDAIRGDVIYAVKPRLPSLGLALLANHRRGVPLILESNDLETVASGARSDGKHRTQTLDAIDPANPALLNPHADAWSELMDPLARELPILATHNATLDAHHGRRGLYMRNIKDEEVYHPARYDRERVRADLGFARDDRIILFGGMLRRHKGIYELIELVKRLNDPRCKLLFVGSRPTPDQERLMRDHRDTVRLLPPQSRDAMARINLAADLVVLWLNPRVAASHYQMPYKATDALAMGAPIIANHISDLGELGSQGYLRLVPFGGWEAMAAAARDIFDNPESAAAMRPAGRRLFLRQFSYAAARSNFTLMLRRLDDIETGTLPVAERFAEWFETFRQTARASAPVAAPAAITVETGQTRR